MSDSQTIDIERVAIIGSGVMGTKVAWACAASGLKTKLHDRSSGQLDAATTARDAGVKTLVLVHLTEQLETPGVRERVLHEVGEVFDGQVILGQDLLEVPMGTIDTEPVR